MAFADLINALKSAGHIPDESADLPQTVSVRSGYTATPVTPDPVGLDAATPPVKTPQKGMTHEKLNEIDSAMQSNTDSRDIAKLLSDYDAASKQSHMDKAMNGFTRAGMTVGNTFGGEKPDEAFLAHEDQLANQPLEDLQAKTKLKYGVMDQSRKNRTTDLQNQHVAQEADLGDTVIQKNSLANANETGLQDSNSPSSQLARSIAKKNGYDVPDNASAKDVLDNMPLLKSDMDAIEKAAHERESNRRTAQIVSASNERNRQDNATKVLTEEQKAAAQANSQTGRGAEVQQRASERMINGFKWDGLEKGVIPSQHDANSATELKGRYHNAVRLGMGIVNTLQTNPRNLPLSTIWSDLKTDIADLVETRTKLKGDGVMNGKDWDHAMQAIGDPNSFAQWINHGGLTQMKRMLQNAHGEYIDRMKGYKFIPGDMSIEDVKKFAPGAGGFGSGGNTLQPDQESFDTMYANTGIGGQAPKFNTKKNPSGTPDIPSNAAPTADVLRAKLNALRGK